VLRRCISCLEGQTYGNMKVVIVDNASGDGWAEAGIGGEVDVEVVRVDARVGFARGNNIGIRHAMGRGARYVALLNDDAFAEPKWLEELVATAMGGKRVGVVGSKVLFDADTQFINSTGLLFNMSGLAWDRGMGRVDSVRWDEAGAAAGATGAAVLLSCEMLKEAGLLDEGYPAYYEDLDMCMRARKSGYGVAYAPRAVVRHQYSASYGSGSLRKEYLSTFSRVRFVVKFFPGEVLGNALMRLVLERLRSHAGKLLRLRPWGLLAALMGLAGAGLRVWSAVRDRTVRLSKVELDELAVASYGKPKLHIPGVETSGVETPLLSGGGSVVLEEGWYAGGGRGSAGCWMARRAGMVIRPEVEGRHELRIQAWFPEKSGRRPSFEVLAGEGMLGKREVEGGLKLYEFGSVSLTGAMRFSLELSDFIPAEESGDYRDLGLKICRIELNWLDERRKGVK